jgi:hypothetical protein
MVSGIALALLVPASSALAQDAPRIFLDQPERIVEYQLNRLSDAQLVQVERRDDEARYRPVYKAIALRAGIARADREAAIGSLAKLSGQSMTAVLFELLGAVQFADLRPAEGLVAVLAAQPIDRLRADRGLLTVWFDQPDVPEPVLRGAFAGLLADGESTMTAWELAEKRSALAALLRAVHAVPADRLAPVAADLTSRVESVAAAGASDDPTRSAAVSALSRLRPDAATVKVLSTILLSMPPAAVRAAAMGSLLAMPESAWSGAPIEELAAAVVAAMSASLPAERTEPAWVDASALGERLAARLPAERGRALRREIRALGVQVVRISAIPEQVSFDVRWFAVEAGRPIQIVLVNPDAMPHNLVIGRPGSLEAIGTAGGTMPMPSDPAVKPFVPDLPSVLYGTRLVQQGETDRLSFLAPREPGAYIFACTFPGHWTRMYGVMLVVPDIEAFEQAPTPPVDPMTGRVFEK